MFSPPLVQSVDIPQSKFEESLDTYTDEGESNSYGVVPPVSPSISYQLAQTQIISHIMDFFWFFFNNANYNDPNLSDKDISFECSSPAYRMSPSTNAVNEDTLPQPQLASMDLFLKYDCHNLSRQLVYFLGIKIIPKLPSYQFIWTGPVIPDNACLLS